VTQTSCDWQPSDRGAILDDMSGLPPRLVVPERREIYLAGRGTTAIRELRGPLGAPALMLLHGLGATGALNWAAAFSALAESYRVIAVDHRGHGAGIRAASAFRLADCADDVVALADRLGVDRFVAVGYSMGGPIAQLAWHRHPTRVSGLVLCATSTHFMRRSLQTPLGLLLGSTARALRPDLFSQALRSRVLSRIPSARAREFVTDELSGHEQGKVMEAMAALLRFSSHDWIGNVDVPSSVVVTTRDQLVPPTWQYRLGATIPGAKIYEVEADHFTAPMSPSFVRRLREACDHVLAPDRRSA